MSSFSDVWDLSKGQRTEKVKCTFRYLKVEEMGTLTFSTTKRRYVLTFKGRDYRTPLQLKDLMHPPPPVVRLNCISLQVKTLDEKVVQWTLDQLVHHYETEASADSGTKLSTELS